MNVTQFPPAETPRLRLVEAARDDAWSFDRAFSALDHLTLIQRDLMMAACVLKHGEPLEHGNAVFDGETLRALLPLTLKIIELGGAQNRDRTLSAAIRHWLQENGD